MTMTMTETLLLTWAWATGMILGTIFFWGLWWTVRRGLASRRPALWFLGSVIVRMSIVMGGFLLFVGPHWPRMLLCLAGFTMARFGVTWLTGRHMLRPHSVPSSAGLSHAPQP
jgi:F1F0 ATPase subunit 2